LISTIYGKIVTLRNQQVGETVRELDWPDKHKKQEHQQWVLIIIVATLIWLLLLTK
jgi:hypothetical protein